MPENYDPESSVAVSVVIPSYNEEQAIGKVIDDVRAAMTGYPQNYEILVVDDHSRDRTATIAREHGVRVIERPMNGGSVLHARPESAQHG